MRMWEREEQNRVSRHHLVQQNLHPARSMSAAAVYCLQKLEPSFALGCASCWRRCSGPLLRPQPPEGVVPSPGGAGKRMRCALDARCGLRRPVRPAP